MTQADSNGGADPRQAAPPQYPPPPPPPGYNAIPPQLPPGYYAHSSAPGPVPQYGGPPRAAYRTPGTNALAIVALVAAFIFWPLGLFLGVRAYQQIRQAQQDGAGLAIAAMVISGVFAVASIVVIVVRARHG